MGLKIKEIVGDASDLERKIDIPIDELKVLLHAYYYGYFTEPKEDENRPTIDELSKSLNMSSSTYHRMLMTARDKVVRYFFESEPNLDP